MISSNATEVTIDYFINTLRVRNPKIIPAKFMSDYDKAQINVIKHRYPKSQLYLCWWHILYAWQQFEDCWEKIQQLVLVSFIEYISKY